MSGFSDAVAALGMILKSVSSLIVLGFLVYSMYFTGDYDLGFFKGVLAFIALSFFVGFTSMVPFGTTFAPILFEWWWHDIPFWDFTTPAWVITGISMLANVLVVAGLGLSKAEQ
jgi:hypothetical protein